MAISKTCLFLHKLACLFNIEIPAHLFTKTKILHVAHFFWYQDESYRPWPSLYSELLSPKQYIFSILLIVVFKIIECWMSSKLSSFRFFAIFHWYYFCESTNSPLVFETYSYFLSQIQYFSRDTHSLFEPQHTLLLVLKLHFEGSHVLHVYFYWLIQIQFSPAYTYLCKPHFHWLV